MPANVAQLVEQSPRKGQVTGSSPVVGSAGPGAAGSTNCALPIAAGRFFYVYTVYLQGVGASECVAEQQSGADGKAQSLRVGREDAGRAQKGVDTLHTVDGKGEELRFTGLAGQPFLPARGGY